MNKLSNDIEMIYESGEGDSDIEEYHTRHSVSSLQILTILNPKDAINQLSLITPHIQNKIVIEIGAGIGFFALELAKYAKQVFAIEADPSWSWIFTKHLYKNKPENLTWIFGSADSIIPYLKGDIGIYVGNSGIKEIQLIFDKIVTDQIILHY